MTTPKKPYAHYCYAIEYAYGPNVPNRGGQPNILRRFKWGNTRRQWVEAGPELHGPGYREAVRSTHPYVRVAHMHPERWEDDAYRIGEG